MNEFSIAFYFKYPLVLEIVINKGVITLLNVSLRELLPIDEEVLKEVYLMLVFLQQFSNMK